MGPFQRLAIDVFLQKPFLHHQAEVFPRPAPGGVGGLVDDVAQVVQPPGHLRTAVLKPKFAGLAAFPGAGGEAQDLDFDLAAFKRSGQHVGGNRGDRDRPTPHRARIVQQKGDDGVAEFGVFLDLEGQGRGGVGHHPGQPPGVKNAFFAVEFPRPVLLRLKPPLELVGKSRHRPFQGFELLIEIGAQPFEFGRFGQILGADFLIVFGAVDLIGWVGLGHGRRRGRLERGFAFWQFRFVAQLLIGRILHRYGGFLRVLLGFLGLVRRGLGVIRLVLVAGALRFVLGGFLALGLILVAHLVGVVAQLVAVAQVIDHLAGEAGKAGLIGQRLFQPVKRAAGLTFKEFAPERQNVVSPARQVPACGQVADQVSGRDGQRCFGVVGDLVVASPQRVGLDLGIDVARRAGHHPRAHRFAARGFHRVEQFARHLPGGHIAIIGRRVVELVAQRKGIGCAPGQQNLVAGHAAGDLRQAQLVARHAGRIDAVADAQLGVVGQNAGRFGKRLLERVGRVVGGFAHAQGLSTGHG